MSVTFHLYKPENNIKYLGNYLDKCSYEQINDKNYLYNLEISLGAPENNNPNYEKLIHTFYEEQDKICWSDYKKHEMFNLTNFKYYSMKKNKISRSWKRNRHKLKNLNYQEYTNSRGETIHYIPVKEIAYRQGWFLKKRFFKKENTFVIATTKKDMMNFFKQYINYNSKDNRAKETVDFFNNHWCDGYIFLCIF